MGRLRAIGVLAAACALSAAGAGLALAVGEGIGFGDPLLGVVETAFTTALLGLLLVWQRPENRMGAFLLAAGLLFGISALAAGALRSSVGPPLAGEAAFAWIWLGQAPLVLVWTAIILALPDGEVGGGVRRRFLGGATLLAGAIAVAGFLFAGPGQVPEFPPAQAPADLTGPLARPGGWLLHDLGQAFLAALPLLALLGLIGRFRAADPVARQQLKWVLVAVALTVLANAARAPLDGAGGGLATAGAVVGLVAEPLPTLGIALAVMRYRLWELDLFISRALVYGVLWAALSAVFLAVALGAGLLAGGSAVLVPLLLALAVAFAAQPARSRLERFVRRLVYGQEPAGYATVVRYTETLAEAARAGVLAPAVAEAVRQALGTSWAGVWLRVDSGGTAALLHPAALAGADAGPAAVLAERAVEELRASPDGFLTANSPPELAAALGPVLDREAAAMVPLVTAEELVGVLACGERPRRPLGSPDLELLGVLGREAALALRNVRLESELRRRLEEIEAQADELRRSRRRLVSAQDDERRRLERDLHDGVQQQLVALAAKLKRASLAAPAERREPLRDLADEAEESVFALQEVARGIYPSLLADQGLAAALRTHAARLPAAVRVEVEPAVAGRRFGRELEAALYFVALEAMTNAQKHAPDAELTVALRGAGEGHRLALEVHDAGPGFAAGEEAAGTGLRNMADRVAAAGGNLAIDSRPGAGTWVRAEVPLEAPVVPLQRRAGDSRR